MANIPNSGLCNLIPAYDGNEERVSVSQFFTQLTATAALGGWSAEAQLLVVKAKLRGAAADYVRDSPSVQVLTTVAEIRTALEARFTPPVPLSLKLSSFMDLKQEQRESVRQYVTRVEKHGRDIRGLDPAAVTALVHSHFTRSLLPALRRAVLSKQTATLQEALEAAVVEENSLLMMQDGAPRAQVRRIDLESETESESASEGAGELSVLSAAGNSTGTVKGVKSRDRPNAISKLTERVDKVELAISPSPQVAAVTPAPDSISDMLGKIMDKMELLEKRLNSIDPANSREMPGLGGGNPDTHPRNQRPPVSGACYLCGQIGHFAAGCPQRASNVGPMAPPDGRRIYSQTPAPTRAENSNWRTPGNASRGETRYAPRPYQHQVRAEYSYEPMEREEEPLNC